MSEAAHLLSLASFAALLPLGLHVRRSHGGARRRAINVFIGYLLAVQALAGLTQHDNWPFTSHTIAVGQPSLDGRVCLTRFEALDAQGRPWPIDPYSWSPLYDSILQFWFEQSFPRLSAPEQRRVLAFLLQRAEEGRQRRARGERIGFERRLGRAASPYWLLLPRPAQVSSEPYTGLRCTRACWTTREKLADPARETRLLLAEYRP